MKSAIVGCGLISSIHMEALKNCPNAELIACCDIIQERSEMSAAQYGAAAYTDLETMLDAEKPDVLHICTPHYLHVPMAQMAAARGIHIFSEKPAAISKEQMDAFMLLEKQVEIGICFQNRYNLENAYIKELIDSSALGEIKGARAFVTWDRDKSYYATGQWRGKWQSEGGGVLINQSIHTMDLLVYFLGKPVSVKASYDNYRLKETIEVEDTLMAYIRFEKGAAIFYATNAYVANSPIFMEITGEKGVVSANGKKMTVQCSDKKIEAPDFQAQSILGKDYWGAGHETCILDFYRCLEAGEKFPICLSNAAATTYLMLAAYESAKTGIEVYLQ